MEIEPIGIVILLVGILGLFRKASFLVTAFFCATLLGSAAAFILPSLGGTNISPSHLLLGFLAIKLLSDSATLRNALKGLTVGSVGFWLFLTVGYCALSAVFLPRIFAGETFIYPVRVVGSNTYTELLQPSTANLTQSIYLISDFACFFMLGGYARRPEGIRNLSTAVFVTIVLNLIFAVLDLVTYATGTTDLLSIIRNANYSLLADTEIVGFKRIVGSFVEASAFGAATLTYFAYTTRLWLLGVRPALTGTLSCLALLMLIFSTSTTAYVGLVVLLALIFANAAFHFLFSHPTKQMRLLIVWSPVLLLAVGFTVALDDRLSGYVSGIADTLVLSKMSTQSGYERSAWNAQALQTFLDTYGFGAGNGSLRASTFPLAVLASTGIIGAALFAMVIIGIFGNSRRSRGLNSIDFAHRQAAKAACLAALITATVSGALTDLGLPFFAFAAMACAEPEVVLLPSVLGLARKTSSAVR